MYLLEELWMALYHCDLLYVVNVNLKGGQSAGSATISSREQLRICCSHRSGSC